VNTDAKGPDTGSKIQRNNRSADSFEDCKESKMRVLSMRMMRGIAAFGVVWLSVTAATAQTATSRFVSVANKFISTLSEKQRQHILYAFDDEEQRKRWSNFPIIIVPRGGISVKEMNPALRSAAMALLASTLSPRGFQKVQQIMEADEVNKLTDRGPRAAATAIRRPRPTTMAARESERARRSALRQKTQWAARRQPPHFGQRPLLHIDPRNAVGNQSVDAAVRRASPGAQHHHRR
jgi:uncharacterized protein DUF3500